MFLSANANAIELGNQKESTTCGILYTRRFECGFQIKKRGGEWLTLDADEADRLAMMIRPMATYCPLYTHVEVTAMLQLAGKSKTDARKLIERYKAMSATDHLNIFNTDDACAEMLHVPSDDADEVKQ
jgi:hypothetical protein